MSTKRLLLSQGAVALVDDEDYERASAFKWSLTNTKGKRYAFRCVNRTTLYLHTFLMRPPRGLEVDHRNGDGLDCRRSNLRVVTHKQNQANISGRPMRNVYWDPRKGKYRVRAKTDGRNRSFGYFRELEAALGAARAARRALFGEGLD